MKEEKEKFEIELNVKNEEKLYNELDETHNTLNNEIISYIEDKLSKKRISEKLIIKIKSKDDIDEKQIKKAFSIYVNDKIEKNEIHKKKNKLKQTRLFLIGLIFVAISIVVGKLLDTIIYTIISTIGSFAIWEAANIKIVENLNSKIENRKLKSLLNSEIEILKEKQ